MYFSIGLALVMNRPELMSAISMVLDRMNEPVNIVAQSMGGIVAIKAALAAPRKIVRLVLTVTSAGVPFADLGGSISNVFKSNFMVAGFYLGVTDPAVKLVGWVRSHFSPTSDRW
ncbi:alpha/beta hydrolase [Rhizobium sp. Td3]|nr:hypothetical protein [Rhizobium sp. RM]TMV20217.1 alpha/beta hydrolase [Rhizobium sp. Td3]